MGSSRHYTFESLLIYLLTEEKEFLSNQAKMLEGIRGKIWNNARIILDEGDTIRKIWLNPEFFPQINRTISVMSEIHPDLIIDEYEGEQKWIRMRKIDYEPCETRSYEENIKEYIKLREISSTRTNTDILYKDDMSPNNIVWQKSDGKPYLLDWDEMHKSPIKYEKNCYRKLLCDRKWQHIYGSYEELVDKFERMW